MSRLPLTAALSALLLLAPTAPAAQSPNSGVVAPTVQVITDVALDFATEDEDAPPRYDITVAGGRIVSIEPTGGELPAGASTVTGAGLVAMPAFLDAWSFAGCETATPTADQDEAIDTRSDVRAGMRAANRKGIQPGFRAADVVDFGADGASAWRAAGFGTVLVTPSGELLAGRGALVATKRGARRELVLNPEVFHYGTFRASGGGFPSTMMGYFAQLRQFFYDVQRQTELEARYEAGRPDPRPAWDPSLAAAVRLVDGRDLYVVYADRASDIERWLRLADEFGLRIAIAGGREAWQHAELLAERRVPVFLDLNWGEEVEDPSPDEPTEELVDGPEGEESGDIAPEGGGEPEAVAATAATEDADQPPAEGDGGDGDEGGDEAASDEEEAAADEAELWHYLEPIGLREERRRRWEETRDGALVLSKAGVQVLFGTGDRQPKELIAALRELVELGYDDEVLERALTVDAARFLGVTDHLGELAVGRDATLCLWTAHPFEEDSDLAAILVDGVTHEFEVELAGDGPAEGVDATGTWDLAFTGEQSPESSHLSLTMTEDGDVSGSYSMVSSFDDETYEATVSGRVEGTRLTAKGQIDMQGMQLSFSVDAELEGGALAGSASWGGPWGETSDAVSGTRRPEHHHEHLGDEEYACH